jgi:hypothetical protein
MNIQEAYKKLDLARGLGIDRVESQYNFLKSELLAKLSGTQNARLQQVYTNRLEEVESAYLAIVRHFEDANIPETTSVPNSPNPYQNFENTIYTPKPKKKKGLFIGIVIIGVVLIGAPTAYYLSKTVFQDEIDLFRVMDGETRVFVNNLTLRQYPDPKSAKIELFPIGTRLIVDESESPVRDDENRVWKKVRVIHPLYGWDRPDDRFPYPYEGWMATEQCGVSWVADSSRTDALLKIFGNEESGALVLSTYRHGLVDYFTNMSYLNEWSYFGENKSNKLQNAVSVNWGFSSKDCNGDNQSDLIIAFRNANDQKILLMSTDSYGNTQVVHEIDFWGEKFGMRKLTAQELKSLNRSYGFYLKNAIYMDRNGDDNILFEEQGQLYTIYWSGIKK